MGAGQRPGEATTSSTVSPVVGHEEATVATRLRVLELVAERERSVGELVALLGEPQTKV